MEHVSKYTVIIGMNDKDSKPQLLLTEKINELVKIVCSGYQRPFCYTIGQGSYYHHDNTVTLEKNISLMLADISEEQVNEIAKDLCLFLNQESVMVLKEEAEMYFIEEHFDKNELSEDRNGK